MSRARTPGLLAPWLLTAGLFLLLGAPNATRAESGPALPEEPSELATLPERPRPLIEIGERFLAPSRLSSGFTLPTGAVWQPAFVAWGSLRTAVQADFGRGGDQAQWANRLDLFGELSFTPTERIVASIEPFQDGANFTGHRFGVDGASSEFVSDIDFELRTLFFEGDIGELFPRLDHDRWPLDLGFMVGRVPVVFQDGLLIDDDMTAVGLVQNSILAHGTSNLRVSVLAAWDEVQRGGDNSGGGNTRLFGVFSELDRSETSWALDLAYVDGQGDTDGLFGGLSAIRRLRGRVNLTLRLLGSYALDGESAPVDRGLLAVVGASFAPRGTHDVAYLNLVAAAGRYTPAARGSDRGGPLGRVGILFEAFGLGAITAPLANDADQVLGGALGYQKFFQKGRRQVVVELAGRTQYDTSRRAAIAAGLRLQQALGRRLVLRIDAWGGAQREGGGFGGGRSELVVKF